MDALICRANLTIEKVEEAVGGCLRSFLYDIDIVACVQPIDP